MLRRRQVFAFACLAVSLVAIHRMGFFLPISSTPLGAAIRQRANVSPLQVSSSVNHSALNGPIPHTLWFTYKDNVLLTKEPRQYYDNVKRTIQEYSSEWNEINPVVRFVIDKDCKELLLQVDNQHHTTLAKAFDEEEGGDLRADLCRVAALYLHGGYYFDLDLEVVKAFRMDPTVSFSTAQNDDWSGIFFQAFLAATPGHPVLRESLNTMMEYYFGNKSHWEHCMGLVGPCTLLAAWNRTSERGVNLILKEIDLQNSELYPNFTRRGKNDGCHWVVHDPVKMEVYFYSRIVGSRYCPE